MAKVKIFISLLLGLILCLGTSGNCTELIPPDSLSKREQVVLLYRSQIGVREVGKNAGQQVEAYLASTGLGKGYAWCGAFVTWVIKSVGLSLPQGPAWAPSWFVKGKRIKHEMAQAGDVFGIWFKNKNRIAHVGFIDENWMNSSNLILTVEGNTNEAGSREGDGVYRKRRLKKQIYQISNWIPDR